MLGWSWTAAFSSARMPRSANHRSTQSLQVTTTHSTGTRMSHAAAMVSSMGVVVLSLDAMLVLGSWPQG